MQLRDYQVDVKNKIREAFKKGFKSPLCVLPTGAGKTVIASDLCASVNRNSKKAAFIAHRQELILQTSLTMARMGIEHNFVATKSVEQYAKKLHWENFSKCFYNPLAKTTIISVQAMARRIKAGKAVSHYDLLIIDEAHHTAAGQWATVIEYYEKSFIIGMTATPERLDGKGLGIEAGGVFDTLIQGPTIGELINRGNLTQPKIMAPPIQLELSGIRTKMGDYNLKDVEEKIEQASITGDVIEHYKAHALNIPTVAFCPSVKYASYLADEFKAAGISATSIDGKMSDIERRDAIEGLGNGKYKVLTSCEIISEGTDIPIIGAAILLRPTQSLALYMQQVGRALRPYPGKEHSLILDHVGNCFRHGSPTDAREWSLAGRKKRRSKKIDEFLKDINIRTCPNCFEIYEVRFKNCPSCGAGYKAQERKEIKHIDGELTEIDETVIQKIKLQRKKEERQAKTEVELIEIGKSRGYKSPHNWAYHKIRARKEKRYA